MRNLPASLVVHQYNDETFKSDGRESEESIVCPSEWPMSAADLSRASSPASCLARTAHFERSNTMSLKHGHHHPPSSTGEPSSSSLKRPLTYNLCTYLVEHRARLLLSSVSLAFLALFLLVIYRQFGLIVFASTLGLIVGPGIVALAYARRLKAKEAEEARQRALNRSGSQKRGNTARRQSKTVHIFATDVEMALGHSAASALAIGSAHTDAASAIPPVGEFADVRPKLQRKTTQQKITIQLPHTVVNH